MPIPEKEPSPFGIYKGHSLLGIITTKVSILKEYPNLAIPEGRRAFKTINLKLNSNKTENLCPKVDFCKADAHMRRLLST